MWAMNAKYTSLPETVSTLHYNHPRSYHIYYEHPEPEVLPLWRGKCANQSLSLDRISLILSAGKAGVDSH
jgi:hypothetical protein